MTLILGMLLDALLGEPKWLWSRIPHPAVLMGQLISWCDTRFNNGYNQRLKGALTILGCCTLAATLGWTLQQIPGQITDIIILAVILAQKSLVQHVQAVGDSLRLSLGDGKRAVAMIVGRDTRDMNEPAVARSAIESAAENLSDGITAPIFWFAIGGLPGLLIYKITNTADSMIGYRTPKHEKFGQAAARLDDVLNLIPARLTALLIWAVTGKPSPGQIMQEAPLHRSPNAGWPEAAMAYGLNIALSGPRSYDGEIRNYPYVNADGKHDLTADHIDQSINVLWKTWGLLLGLAAITAIL